MILSIPTISGGSYQRTYDDQTANCINAIKLRYDAILKYKSDVIFVINQLRSMFINGHIELLGGDQSYRVLYDANLINRYIKYLVKYKPIKAIFEFLKLDIPYIDAYNKYPSSRNVEMYIQCFDVNPKMEESYDYIVSNAIYDELINNLSNLCDIIESNSNKLAKTHTCVLRVVEQIYKASKDQ